jgi:hypothetical protein
MGVNNDVKEAMINEDGMIEVDKGLFSIEPMIKTSDSLYNWSNVKSNPFMGYPGKEKVLTLFLRLAGSVINWNLPHRWLQTAKQTEVQS